MIEVVDRRDAWVGLSSRPKTITSGPLVGMAEPSTRAKWRALRSARSSTLKKCLTGIHIVRDAIFHQIGNGTNLACIPPSYEAPQLPDPADGFYYSVLKKTPGEETHSLKA